MPTARSLPNGRRCTRLHNRAQLLETYRRPDRKNGPNDTCPCGSGRKYKYCCLNKSAAGAAG
ncbi:MAG: SEC-C metal-binding domain-containing protein [Bryobacteraceae bacterium]